MKIEMGESLIYSWLRHEKLCQLVQTNWKVSPFWELENRQEIEDLFVICRNYFLEKHSLDISKGCSLEQFLKQAEIDGIGIAYSTEAPYIYAVDVAYHEGGLNYGGKDETITKIAQKCIRTALCLYGYFCMSTGEVLFVSPKITPAIETALVPDWAAAPNQNNHRIIRAFLQLQKERGFVCRPELEARCQDPEGHADVYVRDFRGNFTSMKTDAGKSHGKVFRDDGYNITICTEVLATLEQYRSLFEA